MSSEGETFDGAAIRDGGDQWKQMSVIQLADTLSKICSNAKRLKTFSDNRKVSNHGLEIFPEKPAFTNYKKRAVGKILHGQEERTFRGSENALEMDERKTYQLGLAAVEQEDMFQIEQDSKDRSEGSLDFEVELTGEVLSVSQDAAVPKESWLDGPERMQKDSSEQDMFYRQYDFNVSMTSSEKGREQAKEILGMFRERSSLQKMRPQQDIVPSSLEVIPDKKTTEASTVPLTTFKQEPTESLQTGITEETSTDQLSTTSKATQVSEPPHSSPTMDFETECIGDTTTLTTADNKEDQVLDNQNTEETILTSTVNPEPSQYEVRVTEETQGTQTPPNTTNEKEDCTEPSTSPETGKATESTGRSPANVPEVTPVESFETECTGEAQPPPDTTNINKKSTASPEPEETTHGSEETSPLGVHLNPTTNVPDLTTRGLEMECSEETTLSATAVKRQEESETTAALKITMTDKVLGTEPTLSLTPEATTQRSDVTIPKTSEPSDTTNSNKKYREPRTSPEPEKTSHVLETKITEKTLPVHLDTTMSLTDFTTKGLETTETSSGDQSKCPCHGLIHHTPTAFRRCTEKMTAWLKLQKARSRLSQTPGSVHSSTHSNFRSQEALQLTEVSDTVNHKIDISRQTGDQSHLNAEEDDHFYFFDGKLRIRPKLDVK